MTSTILVGDVLGRLRELPDESVHCVVTSPPYWGLRDYGMPGQIGLEKTPEEFVAKLVAVFREVRRVLREDGTCWVNMGDSYASQMSTNGGCSPASTLGGGGGKYREGSKNEAQFASGERRKLDHNLKPKDLVGMPWRLAFALQADGWWLRQDLIWAKPNPMPESVTDRCTKAHEYIFLLTKGARYCYDADAIRDAPTGRTDSTHLFIGTPETREGQRRTFQKDGLMGCNKRSVWNVATEPYAEAHFATFPTKLVEPCILAGCPMGGTVLDPFSGAGTTGLVAQRLGRSYVGIELNPEYAAMSENRIREDAPMFSQVQIVQAGTAVMCG